MANRTAKFTSYMLSFSTIVILTAIGVTSAVIGFIGIGLYVPKLNNYNSYINGKCTVLDHEYDDCEHGIRISDKICYSVMWSVKYFVSNSNPNHYLISTITQVYEISTEALEALRNYLDHTEYTCYYNNMNNNDVQWEKPTSPKPYLIMIIIGFVFTGVYLIVISIIALYRCRTRMHS